MKETNRDPVHCVSDLTRSFAPAGGVRSDVWQTLVDSLRTGKLYNKKDKEGKKMEKANAILTVF